MDQAQSMDRMYRWQRHFYDFTRKYYLLGRDTLLREMEVRPGQHVLEVGCGTARNLRRLAQRQSLAQFYGIDASREMLATAAQNIQAAGLREHIRLAQGLAENLDARRDFGLAEGFDSILFSYSLSMIPGWQQALDTALRNLKPGGTLYIVDFSDQRGLPAWFGRLLRAWLERFGVRQRPGLLPYLGQLHREGELHSRGLAGHYAVLVRLRKRA